MAVVSEERILRMKLTGNKPIVGLRIWVNERLRASGFDL